MPACRRRRRPRDRLRRADRCRAVLLGGDRGRGRVRTERHVGASGSTASRSLRSAAPPRTRPSARPTGIMDQMASMLGRADAAIFLDCRSLAASVVDLGFTDAGLQLVVIDTGVKHSHATGGYGERRAACERGAAIMGVPALRDVSVDDLPRAAELMDEVTFRRVRHIVTENQRVLDTVETLRDRRSSRDRRAAARLARVDARRLRDLGARTRHGRRGRDAAGAIGARMTGGGFGGAAIALVEADRVQAVMDAAAHRIRGIRVHGPHGLHGRSVGGRGSRLVTARHARPQPPGGHAVAARSFVGCWGIRRLGGGGETWPTSRSASRIRPTSSSSTPTRARDRRSC